MVDSQDIVERSLRFESAKHLRGTENVRKALLWIKHNPEGLRNRITEFDLICDDLNSLFLSEIDRSLFKNVSSLKEQSDNRLVPKLSELTNNNQSDDIPSLTTIEDTFKEIDRLTKSGEWQFPTTITDSPNQLATALLIEGYGLLLEKRFKKEGIGRTFVLAFEEVLFTKHKDSQMLKDVLPWMVEESGDFSPQIKQQLDVT